MKKIIATLLILVLAFGLALPALADSSAVYDLCVTEFTAHKTSDHYSGVRIDKVVNPRGGTTIKYTSITADAGFVSQILTSAGMIDRDKTRAELKALTTVSAAVDGAILFKYSSTGGVSLVGIYANGYQFYVKSGYVVMETYNASNWQRVGVLN